MENTFIALCSIVTSGKLYKGAFTVARQFFFGEIPLFKQEATRFQSNLTAIHTYCTM